MACTVWPYSTGVLASMEMASRMTLKRGEVVNHTGLPGDQLNKSYPRLNFEWEVSIQNIEPSLEANFV